MRGLHHDARLIIITIHIRRIYSAFASKLNRKQPQSSGVKATSIHADYTNANIRVVDVTGM